MIDEHASVEKQCEQFRDMFVRLRGEIGKVIVGHTDIVDSVLISLFCGGHVLLEGVPGLGKTLLVRTLSSALTLSFRRIQFTPDLMPADIVGTNMVSEDQHTGRREFRFEPGPIFNQCILADEINRATPKTQSAMLEAMQEHSVTVGGKTYSLPEPFIVLATQNPIEQEGTYPLPEAQLDRFMFKLLVPYSSRDELATILDRTTAGHNPKAEAIIDGKEIIAGQQLVQRVVVAPHVQDYAIRLVLATHPQGEFAIDMTNKFVRFGASPRGVQSLVLASKVRALLDGRFHASFTDVRHSYLPALRHRILLNFEGQAEGIDNDGLLLEILKQVATAPEEEATKG
ncbi:MAG: AAA family ATPase [Planctomycetes bacterium]|nr:AAA family ATPase [Planctomycetota bacterium]